MDFASIGRNIRKFRLEKNLRQEDLAEQTGLSSNYIGMVERGEKTPSLETLIHIANALQVSADMLLSDVLEQGFQVKITLLTEKLKNLDEAERQRIYDVIETLLKHTNSK